MSDPLTAGLIFGGLSILQGFAQADALNSQADRIEAQGREEAERQRRNLRRVLGQGRANIGASGFDVAGSPLEVLGDNAAEGELDAVTTIRAANREAADVRSRASGAIFSGFIGAGGALLEPVFGRSPRRRAVFAVNNVDLNRRATSPGVGP